LTKPGTAAIETDDVDERLVGFAGEPKPLRFYRRMRFIRRFEETLLQLFEEGILNGTTHCYIGQEANAVALFEHIHTDDHVFSNHRCHGHYLAQSGDALGLLAEIMGKEAGVCRGIGGSQHISAPGFKSNGILGGTVPTAAGIAMAMKLRASDRISVVFMGDGTMGEGVVYETMNIAALWKLPLLFVVENNHWAQSTPIAVNVAGQLADRFRAFHIPVREADSNDVLELDSIAAEEVGAARRAGPRALILETYRLCHHSKSSDARPEDEVKARWSAEPLVIHGPRIGAERARIDREVEEAITDVVKRARALP
jgi:TPP-dependent pyruvate/acetoin dehydrogenase alpha subunit